MNDEAYDSSSSSSSSDNSSAILNQLSIRHSNTTANQAYCHYFRVRCLSEKKKLIVKKDTPVDDIKKDAFALYKERGFNDDNAILTYVDNNHDEVLLTSVPDLFRKGQHKKLFIRFVHPVCWMCSNPFGIIDSQRLLQCSRKKCGVQYCNSCVQAAQGASYEHPFVCIACKKNVTPQRNKLIEEHIIWKSMRKLYETQSMLDLKEDSTEMFCYSILQNIKFRRIHLQSRLNTLTNRVKNESLIPTDQQLIQNVKELIIELENLVKQIEKINHRMVSCGIASEWVEKYKEGMEDFDRLCDRLTKSGEKLKMNSNNVTTDTSIAHKKPITKSYRMDNLQQLSSEQNIKAIDDILEDAVFRENRLLQANNIGQLLQNEPKQITLLDNHNVDDLKQVKKKLDLISIVKEKLSELRVSLQAIKDYTDEYDKLLRDDEFKDIVCSKFILLLEMMRVRTEELEISNNFPETMKLMRTWQNDHGKDDEFKPKVIHLFENIELDMKHLLSCSNCIYSLSYRIGVIGDGSVGKSALIMKLTGIEEFSSMVAVERSTFAYLEFDTFIYKNPDNGRDIPFTFVDIEGAIDIDKSQSIGNYIELISKADCDMYIIVFDKSFSEHNRTCQKHIEKELQRKCLLVWNKADEIFRKYFKQITNEKYNQIHSQNYYVKVALEETKKHVSKTFDDKRLNNEEVYLTAAACDDDLKNASFATFDLDKLKKELVKLAITDFRGQRIYDLAVRGSITVINTCFRRGYTISQTKYRLLAAGASIIPFLDALPTYFGLEKIRQAFGVHDNSAVTHAFHRTKDSFKEFLLEKEITIPEEELKSDNFKYLISDTSRKTTTMSETKSNIYVPPKEGYHVQKKRSIRPGSLISAPHNVGTIASSTTLVVSVVGKVIGGARFILPATSAALKAASIAGIVVGAALIPLFAAWSFYYTGNRMNEHLHLLCDDLINILRHFVDAVCDDCENIQITEL